MLRSLTQINACSGISIRLSGKSYRVSALSIVRNGKQLDLIKRIKDKPNLTGALAELPDKSVVSLNIAGKGVLHKEVDNNRATETDLFARVMPGSNKEDFYFQQFTSGDRTFLSIFRKADVDAYISQITQKGFRVVMLSFGAFPLNAVLEQMNQYGEELLFDGHEIKFDDQRHWINYRFKEESKNEFPIKLGLEQIDEQLLLPYAAAFQTILYEQLDPVVANADLVQEQMDSLRQTGLLRRKAVLALSGVFLLLLINFLTLTHLTADNGRLQEELSLHSTQASDVNALAGKTAKTEELIKIIGYSRTVPKAIMLDQLAALMPAEIHLSAININPLAGRRTGNAAVPAFSDRRLIITGACSSIQPVNEWLARIRSLKWVAKADLKEYGLGNEDEKGVFTVIINF
jgi:Tfp pilus assembly protein PilN